MAIKRRKGTSDSSQLAIIEPSLDIERDATLLGDVLSSRGEVTAEAIASGEAATTNNPLTDSLEVPRPRSSHHR